MRTLVLLFVATSPGVACSGEAESLLGRQVEDFALKDFRGKQHRLADFREHDFLVVAFLGTECPLAKLYAPRMAKLADQFEPRGVAYVGINSNSQDSITEIAAYARIHGLEFPLLKDLGNRVADMFQAERTPEVFVLDDQRRVVYHGRIDDQYGVGYARDKPQREDLRTALEELLAGKPVSRPETTAVGCFIGRVSQPQPDSRVTYSNQIARILQRRCVECHREGEIAPFALTSYDEVAGWAETIEEVVRDRRMPPWHANPEFGEFENARAMPETEKQLLYEWVAKGAPQGDPADLPQPQEFTPGWRLPREPDQVIAMRDRPFEVAAEGVIDYQYFVVDPGFQEDKWITAAEVIPGNRRVVHHAIVFVRKPGEIVDQSAIGSLGGYVPGQVPVVHPPGRARHVPAGSKLIFQMHYTPTGSVQRDVTKVGLLFADPKTIQEEVVTLVAIDRAFEIPPHAADYPVAMQAPGFPHGGKLLSISPHMHLRGKSFRCEITRGGKSEILLDVPNYDFNWQHVYRLTEPLALTRDLRIHCASTFDNSAHNLVNPDPTASVRWGDQTWEEMAIAFLEVAIPVDAADEVADRRQTAGQEIASARAAADHLFKRFDANADDVIEKNEVSDLFAIFGFPRLDTNADGRITRSEAIEAELESKSE